MGQTAAKTFTVLKTFASILTLLKTHSSSGIRSSRISLSPSTRSSLAIIMGHKCDSTLMPPTGKNKNTTLYTLYSSIEMPSSGFVFFTVSQKKKKNSGSEFCFQCNF